MAEKIERLCQVYEALSEKEKDELIKYAEGLFTSQGGNQVEISNLNNQKRRQAKGEEQISVKNFLV